MTNSIFLCQNLSNFNFVYTHTLCVGKDDSGREVVQIKEVSYTNAFLDFISFGCVNSSNKTSFFEFLKYLFRVNNFSIRSIKSAMLSELKRLDQEELITPFVKENVIYINENFIRDLSQEVSFSSMIENTVPVSQSLVNSSVSRNTQHDDVGVTVVLKDPALNLLVKNQIQKNEGDMLKTGELASYPQSGNLKIGSPDVFYLGLNPKASQYYNARIGKDNVAGQGSPSCTLFAAQFIDNILFPENTSDGKVFFYDWVHNFASRSPQISKNQENIIVSVREGLRVKLLQKKREEAIEKICYQVMLKAFLEKNVSSLNNFRHKFIESNNYPDLMDDDNVWKKLNEKERQSFLAIRKVNEKNIRTAFPRVHPDELQAIGSLNRKLTSDEVVQIVRLLRRPENLDQILLGISMGVKKFLTGVWEEEIPGNQLQNELHKAVSPSLKMISVEDLSQIKELICMSYLDQRFGVGDLMHKTYKKIAPKCIRALSAPKVIKHTERALKEFVIQLTTSTKHFSYAIVTTPNNETYSVIYSPKTDLAIVFDSHRSCAHLASGEEGLFSLMKNIHTGQNLDLGKKFEDGQKPPFENEKQEVQIDPNAPNYLEQLQMMAFGGGNELPESIVSIFS